MTPASVREAGARGTLSRDTSGWAHGVLVIGASTGGTQAIESLLTRLPADLPPTLIVQHMPAGFTSAFAARLNVACPMVVREAAGRERLERGHVYIAPGGSHLAIERMGGSLRTALRQTEREHHHRPAVDPLFRSAAVLADVPIVGVLLTGMGADGADGMVALRRAGAETIAEAEASAVVFGMPKAAIDRGGATHVAALPAIPALIVECFARLLRRHPGLRGLTP